MLSYISPNRRIDMKEKMDMKIAPPRADCAVGGSDWTHSVYIK